MSNTEIIAYVLSNFFRIYVLFRFTNHFFREKRANKAITLIGFIVYFLINSIAYFFMPGIGMNIITNVIPYFALTFLYKSKISVRALITIIVYSISIFADIAVFSVQSLLHIDTIVVSSGVATSLVIFLIELLYEYFFRNTDGKEEIRISELLLIVFVPLGSLIIAIRTMRLSDSNYLSEAVVLFGINGIVFHMYDSLKKSEKAKLEKVKLEQQNLSYINQIKIREESENQMRMLRHDMKNHIYQIKSFASKGDLPAIEQYANSMLQSAETDSEICNSGNYDVDSIVNLKLTSAKKEGAQLHLDVKIPRELRIDSFDLNRILGNLFDNALTAIEKADRKIIYFQMLYEKGVLNLCLRNTFNGVIKVDKHNQLLTLKKDQKVQHGLGIKSVISTVEKYDGEFEYECDNDIFSVYIMMYEK